MKRAIIFFVIVLAIIGDNISQIYSNYEYDTMSIFVQGSMIVTFTHISIEGWITETRKVSLGGLVLTTLFILNASLT